MSWVVREYRELLQSGGMRKKLPIFLHEQRMIPQFFKGRFCCRFGLIEPLIPVQPFALRIPPDCWGTRLSAITKDIEDDVHPAAAARLDMPFQHALLLAFPQDVIHLLLFPPIRRLVIRQTAQLRVALEDEAGNVHRKGRRGIRHIRLFCIGLVCQSGWHRDGTELGSSVHIDDAILADDDDSETRWAEVLLCPRVDDSVVRKPGYGVRFVTS